MYNENQSQFLIETAIETIVTMFGNSKRFDGQNKVDETGQPDILSFLMR